MEAYQQNKLYECLINLFIYYINLIFLEIKFKIRHCFMPCVSIPGIENGGENRKK